MKILIIEDEVDLLSTLTKYFQKEGYGCETATDFMDAYKKIVSYEYDCVLVDLNLPGGEGFNLIRELKRNGSQSGIIIISARESLEDRLKGFESGSDDFLIKPFHLSELNARIKAIVKRKSYSGDEKLRFGNLLIDIDARKITIHGKAVKLTKKEFDILLFLARNKNRVVTKDSIAEHMWGDYMDEAVSFDFIYSHVKNLRKKLDRNGCPDYLKTIYGIGYKFESH